MVCEILMATFNLVHGGNMSSDTWNRLMNRNTYPHGCLRGAKVWDGTKAYLESHGHRVFAPELPDEHTHPLSDDIDSVCSLIRTSDLHTVILVGHSYGRMVITIVAAWMSERVRQLAYIDGALPDPGESLFDHFDLGGVDPLSVNGLEPAAAYVEKITFDPRALRGILKTYVLCTKVRLPWLLAWRNGRLTRRVGGDIANFGHPTS